MASVVVPPTLLSTHQRRDALSDPIEPSTMHAAAPSPMSIWWQTEQRADVVVSVGALALGLACVLALLMF